MLPQSPEPEAHDKVLDNSRSNWNLEMLAFEERGKPEYPEKKPLGARKRTTTNSTHIFRRGTLVGGERSAPSLLTYLYDVTKRYFWSSFCLVKSRFCGYWYNWRPPRLTIAFVTIETTSTFTVLYFPFFHFRDDSLFLCKNLIEEWFPGRIKF